MEDENGDIMYDLEIEENTKRNSYYGSEPKRNEKVNDFTEITLHELQHGLLGGLELDWNNGLKIVTLRMKKSPDLRIC